MHRFWDRAIAPLVEAVAPARMIEIGAEFGWNTAKLLEYCGRAACHLDVVDPVPHPSLLDVLARYPDTHAYHPLKSLEAIPVLPAADLVLLDGDHNWFTVYQELQALFARAARAGVAPPVILLHDMAWPYARRDMYYDPDSIALANRHRYAKRGIIQGESDLSDRGLNGNFYNALHEGGPRNGVLTAVEDFVASWPRPIAMHRLPFFNGLGILVPEARASAALDAVIGSFSSSAFLLDMCVALERDGMNARTDLAACQLKLTQRSEALARARARMAELEHALHACDNEGAAAARHRGLVG
jgi:hypothetical protein